MCRKPTYIGASVGLAAGRGLDAQRKMSRTEDAAQSIARADREIVAWLAETGLAGIGADALFRQFCERLDGAGFPVLRANMALETLHPQVRGYSYVWRRDEGLQSPDSFTHQSGRPESWQQSPVRHMLEAGLAELHCRLDRPDDALEFPIFRQFRDAGMTDWYAACISFGWSAEKSISGVFGMFTSWATERPSGFANEAIARLKGLLPVFALAIKSSTTRDMVEAVVDTYLGPDAGRRVLNGEIQRGTAATIPAVVFYADLRGFTRLADTLERNQLVAMLDDYLDCIAAPVEARGGQVLKFLGDGLLAIFELAERDAAQVCRTALEAARAALNGARELSHQRHAAGQPAMALDVVLHLGDVLYGNVGSSKRLEFTVVGPAVNEASRIEELCEKLGVNLLVSSIFHDARALRDGGLVSFGRHRLRGVRATQELFGLASQGGGE